MFGGRRKGCGQRQTRRKETSEGSLFSDQYRDSLRGIRERVVILTSTHMQQPLAFRNGSSPGGLSSLPT